MINFVVFLSFAWGIFFLMHYIPFRSFQRIFELHSSIWIWVLLALSLSYFLLSFWVRFAPGTICRFLYTIGSAWVGIVFFLFSVFVLYELLYLFTRKDTKSVVLGLLIFVFFLSVYSLWNARILTTKTIQIPLKNLENPIRIVQLSDIHIGTINGIEFLEKIVEKTNAENPDIVVITGDLFDGSGPVDAQMLAPLEKLHIPAYFTLGNHEVYEGIQKVESVLQKTPITVLRNESVTVGEVQIIGIDDPQARPRNESLEDVLKRIPLEKNKPTLLLYHVPSEWETAQKYNVDLQLSGHTHNGQIFPFTLLVKIPFPYTKGLYKNNGKYFYVSPGTGTWGPPMRLGSQNEITIIDLVPNYTRSNK